MKNIINSITFSNKELFGDSPNVEKIMLVLQIQYL